MGVATPSPAPASPGFAAEVAKYWWLPVLAGVLTVVVGLIALAYPGPTLVVVGFLFGIYLVVWGLITLVSAAGAHELPVLLRIFTGVLALITLFAGLLLMVRPGESVVTAALVLGLWWVMSGAIELARGFAVPDARVAHLLWGALGIAAGTVILLQPKIGLGTLVLIVGIGLLFQGAAEIAAGLSLRRAREALA
jgi:uncharacterized membrane protein HdeD (DUF308 family)